MMSLLSRRSDFAKHIGLSYSGIVEEEQAVKGGIRPIIKVFHEVQPSFVTVIIVFLLMVE